MRQAILVPKEILKIPSSLLQRFDTHFSDALRKEYSSKGIIVQVGVSVCVCVCVCMCVGVWVCGCVCACVQTMSRNSSTYHYFILALLFLLSFCPLLLSYPPSVSLLSTFHFSFPLSQVVKPHFVATAMSGIQRTSRFIPDPVTYTRAAVATIGIQHTTYGYFYHALQVRISVAMVTDLSHV